LACSKSSMLHAASSMGDGILVGKADEEVGAPRTTPGIDVGRLAQRRRQSIKEKNRKLTVLPAPENTQKEEDAILLLLICRFIF